MSVEFRGSTPEKTNLGKSVCTNGLPPGKNRVRKTFNEKMRRNNEPRRMAGYKRVRTYGSGECDESLLADVRRGETSKRKTGKGENLIFPNGICRR